MTLGPRGMLSGRRKQWAVESCLSLGEELMRICILAARHQTFLPFWARLLSFPAECPYNKYMFHLGWICSHEIVLSQRAEWRKAMRRMSLISWLVLQTDQWCAYCFSVSSHEPLLKRFESRGKTFSGTNRKGMGRGIFGILFSSLLLKGNASEFLCEVWSQGHRMKYLLYVIFGVFLLDEFKYNEQYIDFFYSDKLSIYYNEAIGYNYIHVGTEREALE